MTLLAVLLLAVSARAAETSAGVGATATAGSEGYRSLAVFADADWEGDSVQPYVWGNTAVSRDSRRVSAVGGAAKGFGDGWRANGGAGFSVGRLVDTDGPVGALILEAGAGARPRTAGRAAAAARTTTWRPRPTTSSRHSRASQCRPSV